MKRINYVGSVVLVGDEFGDLMLEYAASLARAGTSETLKFRGIAEADLREVEFNFIIGPASEIVVESVPDASAHETDNTEAIDYIRRRMAELRAQQERNAGRPHIGTETGSTQRMVITPEPASERSPLVDGLDI